MPGSLRGDDHMRFRLELLEGHFTCAQTRMAESLIRSSSRARRRVRLRRGSAPRYLSRSCATQTVSCLPRAWGTTCCRLRLTFQNWRWFTVSNGMDAPTR
jgi:hypothetical protein